MPVKVIMRFCVSMSTNATSAVMIKKRNRIVWITLNLSATNSSHCRNHTKTHTYRSYVMTTTSLNTDQPNR